MLPRATALASEAQSVIDHRVIVVLLLFVVCHSVLSQAKNNGRGFDWTTQSWISTAVPAVDIYTDGFECQDQL